MPGHLVVMGMSMSWGSHKTLSMADPIYVHRIAIDLIFNHVASHSNISYELEVTFLSATVLVFDTKREAIGLNFSGEFKNEVVLPRWALAAVGLNPHLPHHQISISRISKTILYSCRSMALTNHWLFCSGKNFKSLFMSLNLLSHVFLFEPLSLPSLDGGRTLSRVFLANNQITHRTYLHRG